MQPHEREYFRRRVAYHVDEAVLYQNDPFKLGALRLYALRIPAISHGLTRDQLWALANLLRDVADHLENRLG